jgi:GDP-L-fucose synthase
MAANAVGFSGSLRFDASMPDSTPRMLDVSRATALRSTAKIPLDEGLASTYGRFLNSQAGLRV